MRDRHQHPLAAQQSRQLGDLRCRYAANVGGPSRILRLPVLAAQQIVLEILPALAELRQEYLVMPPVGDQLVHQGQHQRHVGTGHGRYPLRLSIRRKIR
ncbi:hypothetical protein G6F58_012855 [Rhizopus delemar]|nr:hypothetical protein G6F58_012855 [Rhizopus delemar]